LALVRGAPVLELHHKYATSLGAGIEQGQYRRYNATEALVHRWERNVEAVLAAARDAHPNPEGVWEERLIAANCNGPLRVLDRQIQVPGIRRRIDLLAIACESNRPPVAAVIEIKRDLDNRIQYLPNQIAEYLCILAPKGEGLDATIANSYALVAKQMKDLGLIAPAPESITPGMPVTGVVVLANYREQSRLFGRAAKQALGVDTEIWCQQVTSLDCRLKSSEWQHLHEAAGGIDD
jgi:hypothetical protein